MKILYVGGQKSGKTSKAIAKTLQLSKKQKPIYIATYMNIYSDSEMQKRIDNHKIERQNNFITIEEGIDLIKVISSNEGVFLIDCVSMWIFNMLENKKDLIDEMKKLLELDKNIIFILNDVSSGIIPIDRLSREFVDYSGIIGQMIAEKSNEVYQIIYGLENKLK